MPQPAFHYSRRAPVLELAGSKTPMHAAHKKIERGIEYIRKGLRVVRQTAEQSLGRSNWTLLVGYIIAQINQKP